MRKRNLILLVLLFFLLFSVFSRQFVILFNDGSKAVYDMEKIEEIRFEDGSDVFSTLEGVWKGDRGIKNCYINETGVFSIQLNNGYCWSGYCKFENNHIIFETPYPIPVEYLSNYNIPINIAKQAIKVISRPDRWIFILSHNGLILEGQKRNFRLQWNDERILSLEYVARGAFWQKQ